MLQSGMTSVTFRQLTPQQIVELSRQGGLDGIEWGGDVHCPPSLNETVKENNMEIQKMTANMGLQIFSYGSYCHLGDPDNTNDFFQVLVDTAKQLHASTIRVWAGRKSSADATDSYYRQIARDFYRLCEIAAPAGLTVSTEYHRGSLTDCSPSAVKLLRYVKAPNARTYWQPNPDLSLSENQKELTEVLPYLSNVHLYNWKKGNIRFPLRDGAENWNKYFSILMTSRRNHNLIMEFVKDDSPEQFLQDAAELAIWMKHFTI